MLTPQFVPKGVVYRDEEEKRALESRNGVIQARFIFDKAVNWQSDQRIEPDLLLELQRLAVNQIYRCAGYFRDGPVILSGSDHKPPEHKHVVELVSEMCEYLNREWEQKTAIHLASFAMWRINWIHPFYGGNGRTSRAFSYLVLCLHLGFPPTTKDKTIPELIVDNRNHYREALRNADMAYSKGVVDISAMEELIGSLLAQQLASLHFKATGKPYPEA